jgi:3-oxoacyl-[acyl-carrier protein] reductase
VLEARKRAVDILVTNAGGPPPGLWTDWEREDFIAALDANMLTPIALMKALVPGMMERGWGRVVNITSQSVKAPIPAAGPVELGARRADRLCRGHRAAGGEVGRDDQQPAAGHPRHRPARWRSTGRRRRRRASPIEEATRHRAVRRSRPAATAPAEEFGATCAFLCSQHAGFIVGQNILHDGGGT